jgi:hypothetical protein
MRAASLWSKAAVVSVVLAVCLSAASASAQEPAGLVYRIEPELSGFAYVDSIWNHTPLAEVSGRYMIHFDGSEVRLSDIDVVITPLPDTFPVAYDRFPPPYSGSGLINSGTNIWIFGGWNQLPGDMCETFDGTFGPTPDRMRLIGSLPISCNEIASNSFDIEAVAEPLRVVPLVPRAGEPARALVDWYTTSGEVVAANGTATVTPGLVVIHGDVEVTGSQPDNLVSFYSMALDLPPLAAGTYQVQYWARHLSGGTPVDDYQLQGGLQLIVQGLIPTTSALGQLLLIIGIGLVAVLVLRR